MMRKVRSAALLSLSAMLLLTACGSKSTEKGTGAAANAAGSADTKTAQVSNEDKKEATSAQAGSGTQAEGTTSVDLPADQSSAAEENPGNVSADATYDVMNQSGEEEAAAPAGINWQGTYSSNSGETLTIDVSDEHTITFSFAVSGISGTADKDGNEAIYNGDDNVQVVFEHFDSSLSVTVLNAEGQVEESTVSGSYSRQ